MKSKSMSPLNRAHAAGGARLGDVEETGGDQRHDKVERGAAEIKGERPVGRARADLAHPHELGQAGDRDQRRVLERHLPEIAEARQREAQDLGQDDPPRKKRPIHADADRRLEFASRDRKIGGAEHFRLIGARDDANGERAGREGRHPDEALVTEE
jgi:hypothetical protein